MPDYTFTEEEIVAKWEPQVQAFVNKHPVAGMEREDQEQELRIGLIKAWRGYNPDKGVKFHTYLYTSLMNLVRTLISKSQKKIYTISLDKLVDTNANDDDSMVATLGILEDESQRELFTEIDLVSLLEKAGLNDEELDFVDLRIQGFKFNEIDKQLDTSVNKIRSSIKTKVEALNQ